MTSRRFAPFLLALVVALGLLPISPASAARNKPPRIKKAVVKDTDGDGMANRIVLTYNERINHKVDRSRFPFKVQGYQIKKINGARRSAKLVIVVKENADAPAKPASIRYTRTRKQPVKDLKKKQAAKQLFTRNIIGLSATPPPPPPPPSKHTLTVTKSGDGSGSVTSNPSGIDCAATCTTDSADYAEGTSVTLTAAPAAEAAPEVSWSGCATSTTTTCQVTMDEAKDVGVMFAAEGTKQLRVVHAGTGVGSVTSNPAGVDCGATCAASYDEATLVTLTAAPRADSKFVGWGGAATCPASSKTCNVVMDDNKEVTVTFDLLPVHNLVVQNKGTGMGVVSSGSDGKISCAPLCSTSYPEGTSVTLTATPDAESKFTGWSGDATCGAATTCTISMGAVKNVIATFDLIGPADWTLAFTITGPGDVQCSVDDGPPEDCAGTYTNDTKLVLTAIPADPTMPLITWGGDCSSATNLPTCNLTMTSHKAVSVTFSGVGLPDLGTGGVSL